jgi:Rho termination factor, N-terminal domain
MGGKIDTIPGTGEPVDRAHTARNLTKAAAPSAGRAANRRQDLEHQTVRQLRERAREAGVQGRSSMTKDQLIKALRDDR